MSQEDKEKKLGRFTFMENYYNVAKGLVDDNMRGKYLMAIVEYGLFQKMPDDPILRGYVQSVVPALDKSRSYHDKQASSGAVGGRAVKYSDDVIKDALRRLGKKATSKQVADEIGMSDSTLRKRDVWKQRDAYFKELEEIEQGLFHF